MMRSRSFGLVFITLQCFNLLLFPLAFAEPLFKIEEEEFKIKHSKLAFVPKITVGVVTGEAADAIEAYDDDFSAKYLYGWGVSGQYNFSKKISMGVDLELAFKGIPNTDLKSIKGVSFGINGMYKFLPEHKKSAFIRGGFGRTTVSIPDYASGNGETSRMELGTFDYFRFGLGLMSYYSPTTTLSSELYFRSLSTEDANVPLYGPAAFNTTYIGLEVAWSMGLLSH